MIHGRQGLVFVTVAMLLGLLPAMAGASSSWSVSGSSGSLAATATFQVLGSGDLQITLTNTSAADVLVPSELLSALFFDVNPGVTFTPVSALLSPGSSVSYGPDSEGNVGGEWAYAGGLSGAPGGASFGVSASGFGLFGNGNLNGLNLQYPVAVDGDNYCITSAGDDVTTGNAQVTGNVALIKNAVVFVLTPSQSVTSVSNVWFQYGTTLTDPRFSGVPEGSSLALLGGGLLPLLGGLAWRRRRSRSA